MYIQSERVNFFLECLAIASEAQDEEIEKRRATASKASFSVSVLEDTPLFENLSNFNREVMRCAVKLMVEKKEEERKTLEKTRGDEAKVEATSRFTHGYRARYLNLRQ